MKYLNKFENQTDYEQWQGSEDYVTPNVALINDTYTIEIEAKQSGGGYADQYFTIEPLADGIVMSDNESIFYSLDNGANWQETTYADEQISVLEGQKILFKNTTDGELKPFLVYDNDYEYRIQFNVYGNIMSLFYGDDFVGQTEYPRGSNVAASFLAGTLVVDAGNLILPAITLTEGGYQSMFENCTALTTAPELPATTLEDSCYATMFYGCTSLTTAPELPATTLTLGCYSFMFYNCTSLTTAPELPATTLASYCYQFMFYGCTSLTTAPELPATTLASYCYQGMFDGCSSLTTAPELPATTLENNCYAGMFFDCEQYEA